MLISTFQPLTAMKMCILGPWRLNINASINSVDTRMLFHFYFHHGEHGRHEKIRSGYCIRHRSDTCITGVSRGKFYLRILSSLDGYVWYISFIAG
jgi:hypothetical protein